MNDKWLFGSERFVRWRKIGVSNLSVDKNAFELEEHVRDLSQQEKVELLTYVTQEIEVLDRGMPGRIPGFDDCSPAYCELWNKFNRINRLRLKLLRRTKAIIENCTPAPPPNLWNAKHKTKEGGPSTPVL